MKGRGGNFRWEDEDPSADSPSGILSTVLAPIEEKPGWMGMVAWLPSVLPIKGIDYLVLPGLAAAPAPLCQRALG